MADRTATFDTTKGVFTVQLFESQAPITTGNFIELASSGFYDGLTFHRYEPGFVVQGGDPRGNGTGGSDKTIKLEIHPDLKHDGPGVIAMARTSDPNSATSQFYFTLRATPMLDGGYAVFGKVTEGMDNMLALRVGD